MIRQIDHIVLTVVDIDKAVAFYENVLKMEPVTFADGRRAVRFGQQKINFQHIGDELRHHALEGSGDLCLITDWPLDDVIAHLKACQVAILEGPVTKQGVKGERRSVYFNDPDNNLLEIVV